MAATPADTLVEPPPASTGAPARVMPIGAPFFALRFGAGPATGDAAIVAVPVTALDGAASWTVLGGRPAKRAGCAADVGSLATVDHLVLHTRTALTGGADIAAAACAVYCDLLTRARELGYPHLVRIWNFVPDINAGAGDAEAYVRFNRGRMAAFDRLGVAPAHYPAATGVGGPPGSPLTVVVAASRVEPVSLENPRQTAAYRYPRRYGPRAPAFARAMLLPDRDGATLFISGTASIVGHESRHDAVELQVEETLANLAQIVAGAAAQRPGLAQARRRWQVYLRDPADLAVVERAVHRQLGGDTVAYLRADICRRELLVEIEGVCHLTGAGAPPDV
jgi:chorismate lyase/3-hydroxybenzoate synthase